MEDHKFGRNTTSDKKIEEVYHDLSNKDGFYNLLIGEGLNESIRLSESDIHIQNTITNKRIVGNFEYSNDDQDKEKVFFQITLKKSDTLSNRTDISLIFSYESKDFLLPEKQQTFKTNQKLFKTGTIAALAIIAIMIPAIMIPTGTIPFFSDNFFVNESTKTNLQNISEQELTNANFYLSMGEIQSAITHYNNALFIDPNNFHVDVKRKIAYTNMHEYQDILRTYESTLVIVPHFDSNSNISSSVREIPGQVFFYPDGIDGPELLIPREYPNPTKNFPILLNPKINPNTPIVYPTDLIHYPTVAFSNEFNKFPSFLIENNVFSENNSKFHPSNKLLVTPMNFNDESKSVELYVSDNHKVKLEYLSGPNGPYIIYPYYLSAENPGPAMIFPDRSFYPFVTISPNQFSSLQYALDDRIQKIDSEYDDNYVFDRFDIVTYSSSNLDNPLPVIEYEKIILSASKNSINHNEFQTIDDIKTYLDDKSSQQQSILLYPDGEYNLPAKFPLGLDYLYILEPPIIGSALDTWYLRGVTNDRSGEFISVSMGASISSNGNSSPGVTGSGISEAGGIASGSRSAGPSENRCGDKCIAPTLGILDNDLSKKMVDDGFTYNGYSVDVQPFYTPFPLLGVNIGQENVATLKIYDTRGPHTIKHIGLAFDMKYDQFFSQSNVKIELDRNLDGTFTASVYDPANILDDDTISFTTDIVKCKEDSSNNECLEVSIYHSFRTPLDNYRFATNVWDNERNVIENHYNHGIKPIGKSMNPPEQYTGITPKGVVMILTGLEDDPSKAVDENGDIWNLSDKDGFWRMDYESTRK